MATYIDGEAVLVDTTLMGTTVIGMATSQLVGFYATTPVNQPDTVTDATGCNGDADTKVNSIIDRLQELGLIA